MGKFIDHRRVARPEPVNTFWTDGTLIYRPNCYKQALNAKVTNERCLPCA